MANTKSVNISQSSESLISVQLYENHGYLLLHLIVVFKDSKDGFWHIVHDDIEINLIWLVSLRIESMLQSNNIGVIQLLHDLELSVLIPLVLINLLDSHLLVVFVYGGLEHHSEGTVSNDSVCIIGETCGLLVFFLAFLVGLFVHF
jgi:hypothetical protein